MHKLIEFLKHQYDPTPHWARTIIVNQEKIMSALSDLQASIADLGTAVTAATAGIDKLLATIVAPGTSDADVEAAVTQIKSLTAGINAEVAKIPTT